MVDYRSRSYAQKVAQRSGRSIRYKYYGKEYVATPEGDYRIKRDASGKEIAVRVEKPQPEVQTTSAPAPTTKASPEQQRQQELQATQQATEAVVRAQQTPTIQRAAQPPRASDYKGIPPNVSTQPEGTGYTEEYYEKKYPGSRPQSTYKEVERKGVIEKELALIEREREEQRLKRIEADIRGDALSKFEAGFASSKTALKETIIGTGVFAAKVGTELATGQPQKAAETIITGTVESAKTVLETARERPEEIPGIIAGGYVGGKVIEGGVKAIPIRVRQASISEDVTVVGAEAEPGVSTVKTTSIGLEKDMKSYPVVSRTERAIAGTSEVEYTLGRKQPSVSVQGAAGVQGTVFQPETALAGEALLKSILLTPEERVRIGLTKELVSTFKGEPGLTVEQAVFKVESFKQPEKTSQIIQETLGEEAVYFGSSTTQQLPPGSRVLKPGDVDVIYGGSAYEAQTRVKALAERLKASGEDVRVSAANPQVIETPQGVKVLEVKSLQGDILIDGEPAPSGFLGYKFANIREGEPPSPTVSFGKGEALTASEQQARKASGATGIRGSSQRAEVPAFEEAGVVGKPHRSVKDVAGFFQQTEGLIRIYEQSSNPLKQVKAARARARLGQLLETYEPAQQEAIKTKIFELTGERLKLYSEFSATRGYDYPRTPPSRIIPIKTPPEVQYPSSPEISPGSKGLGGSPSPKSPSSSPSPSSPSVSPIASLSPSSSPQSSPSSSPSLSESPSPRSPPQSSPPGRPPSPSPSPSPQISPASPPTSPPLTPHPRTPSPPPSPPPLTPQRTPPPPPPPRMAIDRRLETPGFRVYVKERGRFVLASPDIFSREDAVKFGKEYITRTARASFKLERLGTSPTREFNVDYTRPESFRPSKKDPSVTVQKRKFRISTPGEKAEITQKGIATRKKKSFFSKLAGFGKGGFRL